MARQRHLLRRTDPGYPKDVPQREQDFDQAKSLLKQAGYDNDLTVTLSTARPRLAPPTSRRRRSSPSKPLAPA